MLQDCSAPTGRSSRVRPRVEDVIAGSSVSFDSGQDGVSTERSNSRSHQSALTGRHNRTLQPICGHRPSPNSQTSELRQPVYDHSLSPDRLTAAIGLTRLHDVATTLSDNFTTTGSTSFGKAAIKRHLQQKRAGVVKTIRPSADDIPSHHSSKKISLKRNLTSTERHDFHSTALTGSPESAKSPLQIDRSHPILPVVQRAGGSNCLKSQHSIVSSSGRPNILGSRCAVRLTSNDALDRMACAAAGIVTPSQTPSDQPMTAFLCLVNAMTQGYLPLTQTKSVVIPSRDGGYETAAAACDTVRSDDNIGDRAANGYISELFVDGRSDTSNQPSAISQSQSNLRKPETVVLKPEIGILQPESDIHVILPGNNLLQPEKYILNPEIDSLRPTNKMLHSTNDTLQLTNNVLQQENYVLQPEKQSLSCLTGDQSEVSTTAMPGTVATSTSPHSVFHHHLSVDGGRLASTDVDPTCQRPSILIIKKTKISAVGVCATQLRCGNQSVAPLHTSSSDDLSRSIMSIVPSDGVVSDIIMDDVACTHPSDDAVNQNIVRNSMSQNIACNITSNIPYTDAFDITSHVPDTIPCDIPCNVSDAVPCEITNNVSHTATDANRDITSCISGALPRLLDDELTSRLFDTMLSNSSDVSNHVSVVPYDNSIVRDMTSHVSNITPRTFISDITSHVLESVPYDVISDISSHVDTVVPCDVDIVRDITSHMLETVPSDVVSVTDSNVTRPNLSNFANDNVSLPGFIGVNFRHIRSSSSAIRSVIDARCISSSMETLTEHEIVKQSKLPRHVRVLAVRRPCNSLSLGDAVAGTTLEPVEEETHKAVIQSYLDRCRQSCIPPVGATYHVGKTVSMTDVLTLGDWLTDAIGSEAETTVLTDNNNEVRRISEGKPMLRDCDEVVRISDLEGIMKGCNGCEQIKSSEAENLSISGANRHCGVPRSSSHVDVTVNWNDDGDVADTPAVVDGCSWSPTRFSHYMVNSVINS